jgi:PAS domain S-box-containing protein
MLPTLDPLPTVPDRHDDQTLAFEMAPVGLCVTRERTIERCNPAFAKMFGDTPELLQGKSLATLYPSRAEFDHIGAVGLAVMQRTGLYSDERVMRHRSGRLFWCHVAGRPLQREQPFACAVWMFEDISRVRPVGVSLTLREREIVRQLTAGLSTKEIARELALSPRTVDGHRARILKKVGARSASELISRLAGWR